VQVVDAETGQCRHQMLDRRDRRAVDLERRRQPRLADVGRVRGDRHRTSEVGAMEHNAGIDRRRAQRKVHAGAGMHADAGGARELL
jgi:hypothetical protein